MNIKTIASDNEQNNRSRFQSLYKENPIPQKEQLANIGLFLKRQDLTKVLFLHDLYQKFKKVHGVIMEFGVRWGQNLVTLNNLRGIIEPYNYSRKIIGFDTFEGFCEINPKDGTHDVIQKGVFSVTKDYEQYLFDVLNYHEGECPVSHIKKNTIIKGDAPVELKKYLEEHPETIISFAYFDFDVYAPTIECLKLIKPHLTKGSIIGFDELNDPHFPGETVALKEAYGLNSIAVKRSKYSGIQSYFEF